MNVPTFHTTRRTWVAVALVVAASLVGAAVVSAEPDSGSTPEKGAESNGEIDRVALAATLVRDGHYGRAETELSKVDPTDEGVDRALFFTLRGLVALRQSRNRRAIEHFKHAIRHGETDDRIFVHLAQAYYGIQKWREVVRAVRDAGETGRSIADLYLMKAESERKLDRRSAAWSTLQAGRKRFPGRQEFLRQQVFLLVDMGLYQAALERGRRYLRGADEVAAEDYIAVAEAFRRAGEHRRAQILLEEARAKFRGDTKVLIHLAHAYVGTDDLVAAGELMQVAAESDSKYVRESAALFRRAGAWRRALYMNSRIADQKAKFEQRVAILLDRRAFERIATLDRRLQRLGLLEEPKIAYALAYAHFKTGRYDRAGRLTSTIDSKGMFDAAVELRRAIEKCKSQPWKC